MTTDQHVTADEQSRAASLAAAAAKRIAYLEWLADMLVDPEFGRGVQIRAYAAHELRTFLEGIKR